MSQLGCSTVSWRSKRRLIVALSSNEAEYVTQQAIWPRTLLNCMGFNQEKPTTMFEDNHLTTELTKNLSQHSRTKYADIKFHHVRDAVATKKIYLQYCPTQEMITDLLPKGLSRPQFEKLREELGVAGVKSTKKLTLTDCDCKVGVLKCDAQLRPGGLLRHSLNTHIITLCTH